MSIGRRKRFAILERDDFTCQYCGRRAPSVMLEVDHILPVAHGGLDDEANLVTACEDCNRGKSAVWDTRGYFSLVDHIARMDREFLQAVERIAALEEWAAQYADQETIHDIRWEPA